MVEEITIAKIQHFSKNKNGGVLISKNGKTYTRCLITTTDGRQISGFGSEATRDLKIGDKIKLEITQNDKYLNFKLPKYDVSKRLDALEERILENEKSLEKIKEILGI